ncbi:P-loop NTPase fold protein [Halomicrococcus sp. SG-WS-1]|uniref:P-loop NTPase fold protein n=1 Tax=Halomicrococcus sp. SG-WS-1 TaxID=3439057 RepID=UPI003F798DA2
MVRIDQLTIYEDAFVLSQWSKRVSSITPSTSDSASSQSPQDTQSGERNNDSLDPKPDEEMGSVTGRMPVVNPSDIFSSARDKFDHESHVKTLEQQILGASTPFHIGLFGSWGAGKSTIVNILIQRIRSSQTKKTNGRRYQYIKTCEIDTEDFEDCIAVSVNAWKHANSSVRTDLLLDLNQALADELDLCFSQTSQETAHTSEVQAELAATENSDSEVETTDNSLREIVGDTLSSKKSAFMAWLRSLSDSTEKSAARSPESELLEDQVRQTDDGILNQDEIVRTLYDTYNENEITDQGIVDTIRAISPALTRLFLIYGIGIALMYLIIVYLQTPSAGVLGVISQVFSSITILGVVTAIFAGMVSGGLMIAKTALKEFRDSSQIVERSLKNPKDGWSGAYEELFNTIIQKANERYQEESQNGQELDRIVIVVDDLDRCDSETAYKVLIALKSFLEHEKCVYIIPCDEKELYNHLASANSGEYLSNVNSRQHFLEKFFETELHIPDPSTEQIHEYFDQQTTTLQSSPQVTADLEVDDGPLSEQGFQIPVTDDVIDVLQSTTLSTPRRVNRLLNQYTTLATLVQERDRRLGNEINGDRQQDGEHQEDSEEWEWEWPFIAWLTVVQEDFPQFHQELQSDPALLDEIYETRGGLHRRNTVGSVEQTTQVFDSIGVPTERRLSLRSFLVNTTDYVVDHPTPYLRLQGGESPVSERYKNRLTEDRLAGLVALFSQGLERAEEQDFADQDDPSLPDNLETFVQVATDQLSTEERQNEAIQAVVQLISEYVNKSDNRHRNLAFLDVAGELSSEMIPALEETDSDEVMALLKLNELADFLEALPSDHPQRFAKLYIESIVGPDGIRERPFEGLLEFDGPEDVHKEKLATEFQQAYSRGILAEGEFARAVARIRNENEELFTRELISFYG